MAQDLFGAFDQDIQRLLVAGSGSATGDEGLLRAQEGFGKLAAKVPALATMQGQIGKVLAAKGRAATTELLQLAVMGARLRGAQAKPAAAGELEQLPPAAPLETTTPQHDLEALHRALTSGMTASGKKIHRQRVINDAAERGVLNDLRLVDLWVRALSDNGIGDTVATRVIPVLGEAAAMRIEKQFNPLGKRADARRLQCLVAIRGEAARPQVEACLKATEHAHQEAPTATKGKKIVARETSIEVRAEAVAALEKVAPGEAEDRVCQLYKTEKNQEVRAACVEVMGAGSKDTTLSILLEALQSDSNAVNDIAVESLQRFKHPKTTERVQALLSPEALDIKPYKAPKAKANQKLTKAQQQANQKAEQQAQRAIERKTEIVCRVIRVLGKRPSPVVLDQLIEIFRKHPIEQIRETAGQALKASGEKRALEVLIERLDGEDEVEALAVWAFFHLDMNTVFERMKPYLTDQALSTKKGLAVAEKLLSEVSGDGYYLDNEDEDEDEDEDEEHAVANEEGQEDEDDDAYRLKNLARYAFRKDPRWGAVALRLLPNKQLTDTCATILGNLKERSAVAPLLELLRKNQSAYSVAAALQHIGERSMIPSLVEMLSLKGPRSSIIGMLGAMKVKEAVTSLCDLLAKESDESNQIFDALRRIDDKRATVPVAKALLHKGITSYPYQAIRTLRQFDDPAAIPHLQEALKKAKKSRNSWVVTQFEELITFLERDRKV